MKKIISIFLALCMLFTLYIPVSAASGMQNFVQYNMYDNNFSDVPSSHWAMPSIKACYEYALMYGSSNTKFNPGGELTVAEALVMADRVHSIYSTSKTAVFSGGNPWYKPYVDYAVNNGIVLSSDFDDVSQKITRAQMAYVFYNALPANEFTEINSIRNIPDVSSEHTYHAQIKTLYNAGILTGSDSYGSFCPDKNITRAEAAAIISRVSTASLRKSFSILEPLTSAEIKNKCSPAVAYVQAYNSSGKMVSSGSGYFADAEGTFITTVDAVKDAVSVKIKTADKKEYSVESVYDCDTENNLILFKTNCKNTAFLEADTSKPDEGEHAYAVYALAGNVILSEGDVSNSDNADRIRCNISVPSSSTGAVLLNKYGQVTGIKDSSAAFIAIPAEYANKLVKGSPLPIDKLADFLSAEPVLYSSKNSLNISQGGYGESFIVNFSPALRDYISISTDVEDIVEIIEIKYLSDHEFMLTLRGKRMGRTTMCISYNFEAASDKKLNILITSGTYADESPYYYDDAPSYSSITGIPCEYSYMVETDTSYDYYKPGAAIYGYDYYAPGEPDTYMKALKSNGWAYSETATESGVVANFFIKDSRRISVNVDHNTNTVYIVFYEAELYKNGAPSYQYVVGIPCLFSYYTSTDTDVDGYDENADLFSYRYTSKEDVVKYIEALQDDGWKYDGSHEEDSYIGFAYYKGDAAIGIYIYWEYGIVSIYVIEE